MQMAHTHRLFYHPAFIMNAAPQLKKSIDNLCNAKLPTTRLWAPHISWASNKKLTNLWHQPMQEKMIHLWLIPDLHHTVSKVSIILTFCSIWMVDETRKALLVSHEAHGIVLRGWECSEGLENSRNDGHLEIQNLLKTNENNDSGSQHLCCPRCWHSLDW